MLRSKNEKEGIQFAYRRLTGRLPNEKELTLLENLFRSERDKFNQHIEKAAGWISTGLYKTDKLVNKAQLAAYAVVASTILNSDAVITKR